tara:strand:+ start:54 stop:629 length:576 start_codon:yes stop_codon:yes gene_type:complete
VARKSPEQYEYEKINGKICYRCNKRKLLEEFHNEKKSKDGKSGQCKICQNEAHKAQGAFKNWYTTKKKDGKREGHEWRIEPDDIPGVEIKVIEYISKRNSKRRRWDTVTYPKKCPIFKQDLDWERKPGTKNISHNFSPSLDRIDSSKGYVKGNVMIVSKLANMMKSNATKKQLKEFSEYWLTEEHLGDIIE